MPLQPSHFFGFLNPLIVITFFLLLRWGRQHQKVDFYLALYFLFLYLSMALSMLSGGLPDALNLLVFLSRIFLSLSVLILFMFVVLNFETLKKYRGFILMHLIFVIFIGALYFPNLSLPADSSYNIHPGFSLALLSYLLPWSLIVLYFLYLASRFTEQLTARVKLHLFVLGVFFTFLGSGIIECTYFDSRDVLALEFTLKTYGIVFHTIALLLFLTSLLVPRSLLQFWEGKHIFHFSGSRSTRRLLLIAFAILLNVTGGKITSYFHLPFFADMIGTALIAFTLGPWSAATAGLLTNFLLSIVAGVAYFPFALCNISGGLLWGYFARCGYAGIVNAPSEIFWKRFLKFIFFNGVIVGIAIASIATMVSFAMFGGFSGHEAEFIAMQTQKYLGTAAGNFLARLGIEIFDKTCAALTALYMAILFFQKESAQFLAYRRKRSVIVEVREVLVFLLLLVLFGLCSVPLFFHVLVLPETAIVTPYSWVFLNFVWIALTSAVGLIVLYRWSR